MTHTHVHADGTKHTHEHGTRPEEKLKLDQFYDTCLSVIIKDNAWDKPETTEIVINAFIKIVREVPAIVDLYEHDERFQKFVKQIIRCELICGRWASHKYAHAYVYRCSDFPNDFCTIWTDHDFEKADLTFFWNNYDLFGKEMK